MIQDNPIELLEVWVGKGRPGARHYELKVWADKRLCVLQCETSETEVEVVARFSKNPLTAVKLALGAMIDFDNLSAKPPPTSSLPTKSTRGRARLPKPPAGRRQA